MGRPRTWCSALGLVAWLLCLPSWAQQGRSLIEQATLDFSNLQFESALKKLEKAHIAKDIGRQELVRIYSLGARCLLALGHEKDAERAFKAALSLDPAFRLDPDSSPRFLEPFQKILEQGVEELSLEISALTPISRGQPVTLSAKLVADPAQVARFLVVFYRTGNEGDYLPLRVELTPGRIEKILLPQDRRSLPNLGSLQWYAQLLDLRDVVLVSKGDARHPLTIRMEDQTQDPVLEAIGSGKNHPDQDASTSAWYEKWWVWSIVGGTLVVVGGVIALAATSSDLPDHRDFELEIH